MLWRWQDSCGGLPLCWHTATVGARGFSRLCTLRFIQPKPDTTRVRALLPTGEKKFHEVAASMASRGMTRGTPLRTLALLLAHRPDLVHESPLAAVSLSASTAAATGGGGAAAAALRPVPLQGSGGGVVGGGAPGGQLFSPAGGSGAFGFFSPTAGALQPQGDALLSHWRENLAVMAANRTPGDVEAMLHLGDLLLAEQGQVRLCVFGVLGSASSCCAALSAARTANPANLRCACRLPTHAPPQCYHRWMQRTCAIWWLAPAPRPSTRALPLPACCCWAWTTAAPRGSAA